MSGVDVLAACPKCASGSELVAVQTATVRLSCPCCGHVWTDYLTAAALAAVQGKQP